MTWLYRFLFTDFWLQLCSSEKGKAMLTKPFTFWKWKHISKRNNHILKIKAHSETHFENENMFLEKWKVINPYLRGEVGRVVGQIGEYHSFLVIVFTQYFVVTQKETVSYTKSENVKIIFLWNEAKLVNTKHQNIILWHSTFWQQTVTRFF